MKNRHKYVFGTLLAVIVIAVLVLSFYILRDYSKRVNLNDKKEITSKDELKSSNDIDDSSNLEDNDEVKENEIDKDQATSDIPSSGASVDENSSTNNQNSSGGVSGYNPNSGVTSSVIESYSGKITGYGPDCSGCTSKKTASGMYIGEGNIFYQDSTFGRIRIVAADKRYPFGTIVRISNLSIYNEPILAVVLDRGGSIGDSLHAQFDLLFETENSARVVGLATANFEILRLGY